MIHTIVGILVYGVLVPTGFILVGLQLRDVIRHTREYNKEFYEKDKE